MERRFHVGRAGRDDTSDERRDGPNASIVLKVHVWLATGAQSCREVFADVTGGGGKDICIVYVS